MRGIGKEKTTERDVEIHVELLLASIRIFFCTFEGVLCGGCKNSTGFSALLNTCKDCDHTYIFIVIALGIIYLVTCTKTNTVHIIYIIIYCSCCRRSCDQHPHSLENRSTILDLPIVVLRSSQ